MRRCEAARTLAGGRKHTRHCETMLTSKQSRAAAQPHGTSCAPCHPRTAAGTGGCACRPVKRQGKRQGVLVRGRVTSALDASRSDMGRVRRSSLHAPHSQLLVLGEARTPIALGNVHCKGMAARRYDLRMSGALYRWCTRCSRSGPGGQASYSRRCELAQPQLLCSCEGQPLPGHSLVARQASSASWSMGPSF